MALRTVILRAFAVATASLLLNGAALAGDELLALRANNAAALAGGVGAITIRTYSSRPVNQGQVCIRVKRQLRAGTSNPIASIDQVTVFGFNDDPSESALLDAVGGDQVIMLQFSSKTSAINAVDGPLAVIFFTVEQDVIAGDRYDLEFDLANTTLTDENGQSIPLELRDGRLDIRGPGEALSLAASAEPVTAGDIAFMSVQTNEPFSIAAGVAGFRYNARMFPRPPKLVVDSRYGNANVNVLFAGGGILLLSFNSPDNTLNNVPGDIIAIRALTNPNVQSGVESGIGLDPAFTFLWDETGMTIPIELEGDAVRFR